MKKLSNIVFAAAAATLILMASPVFARDDVLIFVLERGDDITLSFKRSETRLDAAGKSALDSYSHDIRNHVVSGKGQLLILTDHDGSDGALGRKSALTRAAEISKQLSSKLGIAPDRISIIPVERNGISLPHVRIAVLRTPEMPRATTDAAARLGWLPHLRKFVLVCPDGSLPSQLSDWPDDFAAQRDCPTSEARKPAAENGLGARNVAWDTTTARWVILCPDGSPVQVAAGDPDDFFGLRRCKPAP